MSGTRSKLRSEDGSRPAEKVTQISKLFPSSTPQTDSTNRPARKRNADVAPPNIQGPSSTKQTKPNASIDVKQTTNVISKFFQRSEDDDNDDFESPKKRAPTVRKKIAKPAKVKKVPAKISKSVNNIKEKYFSNVVNMHCAQDGTDPDELQLTLAVSRSLLPDDHQNEAEKLNIDTRSSRSKKQQAVHEIFQRFGFKSGAEDYDPNDFLAVPSKRKVRQKWNTKCTALTRRNTIAQQQKIEARTSKIIDQFVIPDINIAVRPITQVSSQYLARFHIVERLYFDKNAETDQRDVRDFYTNNLCEVSNVSAGILLRDWSLIPGRDPSPKRPVKTTADTLDNVAECKDELFLSAESSGEATAMISPVIVTKHVSTSSDLDVHSDEIFLSAHSVQSEMQLDISGVSQDVANTIAIKEHSSIELPAKSSQLLSSPDTSISFELTEDNHLRELSPKPTRERSTNTFDVYPQNSPTLEQRCTRSSSPDMFADEDISLKAEQHEELSGSVGSSSYRACSLDPISSSGSTNPITMTEEDCVLELYATGAVLVVDESRPAITSLAIDDHTEKDNSLDALTMQLNYSGLSEQSLTLQPTTTPNDEHVRPSIEKGDLHDGIDEPDTDLFAEVGALESCDAEIRKSGIVVFESYKENVKIGDRTHAVESINECIEISDDEQCNETDNNVSQNESTINVASTEQVNFSFESVNSDLETTRNTTKTSLSRNLFLKNLNGQSNLHEASDAINESISFSFPSEEMPIKIVDKVSQLCKTSTLKKENSIDISDDEFDYSIHISKHGFKSKMHHTDSIEISDDEINYSMSHESPIALHQHKDDRLLPLREEPLNESLQQIFDENFEPLSEFELQLNNQPVDDLDLINQSVRSFVRKDFVSNTKPRRHGSTSGTTLRRTTSEKFGNVSKNNPSTFHHSRLDDTPQRDFTIDYDSFDDLLQGLNLPDTAQSMRKPSPSAQDDDHQFTLSHDGSTFEVKIGHRCVSPKPNFETMDSPTMSAQLKKYGLKPLVRRKAIICLEHIYNRLHPFVECLDDDGLLCRGDFVAQNPLQSLGDVSEEGPSRVNLPNLQVETFSLHTTKIATTQSLPADFCVHLMSIQSEYYLPSPPRAKKAWCLQPLHIAWFNLLVDNPRLYELILQYEPLELRMIRTTFKDIGLLFDNNDLIAFLDKLCITFRTESTRNKKPSPLKNRLPN